MRGQVVAYSVHFTQTYDGKRIRYYLGHARVPWLIWAMFHGATNLVPWEGAS